MDLNLNEVKQRIEDLCGHRESKMILLNDPLGHYVLLICGCLPGDADYEVVFNPFEVQEEDIGKTGAYIWIFVIRGDRISQYEARHNKGQSSRRLIHQNQSALERLAWIMQNLHPRSSKSSLPTD